MVDETRGAFAEGAKARILAWRRALPDFHTVTESLVAEGDWVAFHFRHQGTHKASSSA